MQGNYLKTALHFEMFTREKENAFIFLNELAKIITFFRFNFKMAKALLNGKSQNYHLIDTEDFFTSFTSKLITYFINSFTSGKKV